MIVDTRANASRYMGMSRLMDRALDFLESLPDGPTGSGEVVEIEGDSLFCRYINSTNVSPAEAEMEVHRDYVDIHMVLEGTEAIRFRPGAGRTVPESYDAGSDSATLPMGQGRDIILNAGEFAVLLPGEVHAPMLGDPGKHLSKIVIKVRTTERD